MAHVISETEAKQKIRSYLKIMVYLTILTIVEVAIPRMHVITGAVRGLSLTIMACWKAAVVGWFYMHLNHETKWTRYVALTPIIAAAYAGVLMLEATSRSVGNFENEGRARLTPQESRDEFEKIYAPYVDDKKAHEEGHEGAVESEKSEHKE